MESDCQFEEDIISLVEWGIFELLCTGLLMSILGWLMLECHGGHFIKYLKPIKIENLHNYILNNFRNVNAHYAIKYMFGILFLY